MSDHSSVAEIRNVLITDREALRVAVDRVPTARHQERPSADRWSVAEVLEHLAIVEGRSVAMLAPQVAAAPMLEGPAAASARPSVRPTVLDRSNRISAPEMIQPTGKVDAATAWTALQASRQQLMSILETAEGRDLTTVTRPHPVLGQIDGYQWIATIGAHEARHTAQILEIADQFAAK